MFYVYLLVDRNSKIYIGFSKSLNDRLAEHGRGNVYTTKKMDDPQLFYYEAYPNRELAREREKKLKQFGSAYAGLLKRLKIK